MYSLTKSEKEDRLAKFHFDISENELSKSEIRTIAATLTNCRGMKQVQPEAIGDVAGDAADAIADAAEDLADLAGGAVDLS